MATIYTGTHDEWHGAKVSHMVRCGHGWCGCGRWEAVLTLPSGQSITAHHMRQESTADDGRPDPLSRAGQAARAALADAPAATGDQWGR